MTATVDFHTHIFPPSIADQRERWLERDATFRELYADPKAKLATAGDLIAAMDEDGVDRAVVMGIGWTDQVLAREANDYIIDAARRHPDRLTGFASVNPAWGDSAVTEVERCAHAGLRGVGELHPDTQGFALGDEAVMTLLLEVAQAHRLIVTTHSSEPAGHVYPGKGRTTPDVLWRFIQHAARFPDVKVVCAHWGGGLPFYALMPEVARALGNVYFDTAASPFLYTADVFSVVADLVGVDKILLGSDYPLLRPARLLRQLDESVSSDEVKDHVRYNGLMLLDV
ncbi:MAG: amidohydrolase family protein [SAR202 cluster bacterium]|nr:amidohydrolase family protein [SAR202 cluster bacterium]